jgi:TolB-like protein/Tfp pilus assembly protein PilF
MGNIFSELRRRNIFRVAGVYAVVGWLLMQFASILESSIGLPQWFDGMVVALLMIGFPLALLLAWAFEMTPEGVRRTEAVDENESITGKTGRKLDYAIFAALVLVAALVVTRPSAPDIVNAPGFSVHSAQTKNSVAVLPFVDLSQAGDQEFFADGISEEILNVLVRLPKLKVAGRTSSFSFKGQNQDLRQIGTALGVDHILEGSVRRSGTKLRITAQLIRGEDGFHLWSETYDRELTDIFEIQDEIARAVADQLAVSLGLSSEPLVKERTEDLIAYEKYLKSHQLFLKRGRGNLNMALLLAGEAVARDPDYAPAWGAIADVYTVYESYLDAPVDESIYLQWRAFGKAAARRSIALNPDDGELQANLGSFYSTEREWEKTFTSFDRALELAPDNADVLDSFAQYLFEAGYYAQANEYALRAVAADPLVALYRFTLARVYFFNGKDDDGFVALEKAMELDPKLRFPYNYWRNYYHNGHFDKAYALVETAVAEGIYPPESQDFMQQLKAAQGDEAALRKLIPLFERYNDPYIYRILGNFDIIMDRTEALWGNETRANPFIFTEPISPVLFAYPRWKQQVRKEGILDLWRKRGFPAHCRPLEGDDFECENYQEKATP